MANRFKDFGGKYNPEEAEPLNFKLYEEEFECYPNLQGKVLLDIVSGSDENDPTSVAKTMTDFFVKSLKPESYERFNNLLEDPDRIVTVETLGEITAWLVEVYTARPTEEPVGS